MARKILIREHDWKLPSKDGAVLYGVSDVARGNTAAVVFVHGATGSMHEYLFRAAVERFVPHGYDCFRFNLYSWENDARRLRDCTIGTHAMDLETVIENKTAGYKQLFVVGHSLGGPVVMRCNPARATAYSLWDPTYDNVAVGWAAPLKKVGRDYLVDWGVEHIIGARMVKDDINYDRAHCRAMARAAVAPVQVVMAGAGFYVKRKESWNSFAPKGSRRVEVAGADHGFNGLGEADKLHALTLGWFDKFR